MLEIRDCIYDEKGNYLEYYDLYDAHGDLIDRIWNIIMFLDVRVQIREKKLSGYYLIDKDGYRIDIDQYGKYDWNMYKPFGQLDELLTRLLPTRENVSSVARIIQQCLTEQLHHMFPMLLYSKQAQLLSQ